MYYLYIKTHNKTGLKYLGQTIRDPNKYKGSGLVWLRHLAKHGEDVTTEIILSTESYEELSRIGLQYSIKYNIVESNEWANLKPETGQGGFTKEDRLKAKTPEAMLKHRQNSWARTNPEQQRIHAKKANRQRVITSDIKNKISESIRQHNKSVDTRHNKGIIRSKVMCPFCNVEGAKNTMSRWHFDNCKHKPH